MLDSIDVSPCSSKCAATGRPFREGQRVVSALVREGAVLRRLDFCEEAWQGPSATVVAWWWTTAPAKASASGARPKPTTLLEVLEGLVATGEQQELAYFLALLLLRRRVLRLEGETCDEGGRRRLIVTHTRSGRIYEIPVSIPEGQKKQVVEDALKSLVALRTEPSDRARTSPPSTASETNDSEGKTELNAAPNQ